MEHFSTVHTSYILNFDFTNNIIILTGLSATGKTASFSFMRECMAVNSNIVCINYQDYKKDIKKIILIKMLNGYSYEELYNAASLFYDQYLEL